MQQKTPVGLSARAGDHLHPLTLPVWGSGLAALLLARRLRPYRDSGSKPRDGG